MNSLILQICRLFCLSTLPLLCRAQGNSLVVGFTSAGLHSLRYGSAELLRNPTFQVNSVQFSARDGRLISGGLEHTASFDAKSRTTRLKFDWGTVAIHYVPQPDRLLFSIATTNNSRLVLQSLSYDALTLRFESRPVEYDDVTPILGTNIGTPTVLPLTVRTGTVMLCNEDVRRPLLVGFPWALDRPISRTFPLRINTGRDSMYPDSLPTVDRAIAPGGTDRFLLSLRFNPSPLKASHVVPDLFALFREMDPFTLNWPDRRPIGSLIIATSAAGWPKNPRGWMLDPKLDTTTPRGVALFQARLLAWADRSIAILKSMNAQGMVTWDIEGEQFPHATTYIGDPRQAETLAPEMRGVLDEYFARFRRAGLRVGVTIRPQTLVILGDGKMAEQRASKDPAQVLIDKIAYARKRWGATLFYIDSNGDPALPLSFDAMRRVTDAFPDVLLMPEHKNAAYYSKTAPYGELRGGYTSTPGLVRSIYKDAFSVVNTADGHPGASAGALQKAIEAGDILMFRAWYNDPANLELKALLSRKEPAPAKSLPKTERAATEGILRNQ